MRNVVFTLKTRAGGKHRIGSGASRYERRSRGLILNTTVTADAKFLRRVFIGLVMLTIVAGAMAALTTVQAMNDIRTAACTTACE